MTLGGKKMNLKDFILKTVLLIVCITIILILWFGGKKLDDQIIESEALKKENNQLKEQVEYLENRSISQTEIIKESEASNIKESVNVFLDSIYNVKEGNYNERKSNAEKVLVQAKFNDFFPETDEYEILYEFEINNVESYINQIEDKKATAFVVFNLTETNVNNDEENDSRTIVQVYLQKEGENWMINNFEQIHSEPL